MSAARPPLAIGIGEVLWDLLPGGRQLGGAPANFAYHAHALGARSWVISAVGRDAAGAEVLARLRAMGIGTDHVAVVDGSPTGTVSVSLDAGGRPAFTIHEDTAWDRVPLRPAALALARRADVICFGTLAQRSAATRRSVRRAIAAARRAVKVFDVNIRQRFYSRAVIEDSVRSSDIVKVSEDELPAVARELGLARGTEAAARELVARYGVKLVAVTRGAGGSLLLTASARAEHPGLRVAVADTVGAGDAFAASVALSFLQGMPLEEIGERANRLAAYVCSRPGSTPAIPPAFRLVGEECPSAISLRRRQEPSRQRRLSTPPRGRAPRSSPRKAPRS